jgi:1-acyl-sn-glycerol-3-phosphate acyltransferase
LQTRALWLRQTSTRVLRILNIRIQFEGPIPHRGFLFCNHVSYIDIPVLSSLTPSVFVAKREIQWWPVFGWIASMAGTLFIHRERKSDVQRINSEMEEALRHDVLLALFPESTSSNGESVLPFRSPLMQPAVSSSHPVSVGFIRYIVDEGSIGNDVAYWGDMSFPSHLLNLLSLPSVSALVRFAPLRNPPTDRKELARLAHARVMSLRNEFSPAATQAPLRSL